MSKSINYEYGKLFYFTHVRRASTVHAERNNLAVVITKVLNFHSLIISSFVQCDLCPFFYCIYILCLSACNINSFFGVYMVYPLLKHTLLINFA